MRNLIGFIFVCSSLICSAQTYKYINTANGLSNQNIYRIQKGHQGYMWFLSHQGIDRYNGKEIKHYQISDPLTQVDPQTHLDWLYTDSNGKIWIIGRKGKVFEYDSTHDCFNVAYRLPKYWKKELSPYSINYGYMDSQDRIWLCDEDSITLYDTRSKRANRLYMSMKKQVTAIEQIDSVHFFIGTANGIFFTEQKQNVLNILPCPEIDSIGQSISELYFHPSTQNLFIGTFRKGIVIYNLKNRKKTFNISVEDADITRITQLNKREVLIATDGKGVYKFNTDSCKVAPYIVANYKSYNEMNGNNITEMYVDNEQRIWLSNYPNGITIRDNRCSNYKWIKHSIGNKQSLINNQVHCIMEDSDGDLWFGTSNGVSLYISKTGKWHSFLSSFEQTLKNKNHIFITLCEVSPGIIWAAGYTSGIYQINKKNLSAKYFSSSAFAGERADRPDQYIRDIKKDSSGRIWAGGYNNLKCFDLKNNTIQQYTGPSAITSIIEKDSTHLWIGTIKGLYLIEKESGNYQYIEMPVESTHIYTLHQTNDTLYIGTAGAGLLVYQFSKKLFTRYTTNNSALTSNNIYTILPHSKGYLILGTANSITQFYPEKNLFHNWTKEHGLMSSNFNACSGARLSNNYFILGSNDGAVAFPNDIQIPKFTTSSMIFSDFMISYQTFYPGDKDSPLETDIDRTNKLRLKHEQNTFSLKVSSVNYDYPSNILYTWKLEGFYNKWTQPSPDGKIHYTNLHPGNYVLHVRAVSNEDKYKIFKERSIQIIIEPPVWASTWAILGYVIFFILVCVILLRIISLKREKKRSEEKIHFFINTAHDIRTPLTMVKAPLEEIIEKEQTKPEGIANINLALKNVDTLLNLTTNLMSLEKASSRSSQFQVNEYELKAYITELYNSFLEYARSRNIKFTVETQFSHLNVWFDKNKMNSILNNLISNAIKYTPEGGSITLMAYENKDSWIVEVKDTGIGIPMCDQKNLFKSYFRARNVINQKISGSGIGLMLVHKLVRLHKGKITISSIEQKGTCIKVSFPKNYKPFKKYSPASSALESEITLKKKINKRSFLPGITKKEVSGQEQKQRSKILIVEDNDDLRNYLERTLSEGYETATCSNGKEALDMVELFNPALIVSDIMMPVMEGDKLCAAIKNNIETSHIPVILLTALGDENNMIKGLETGADDYIAKPFSIGILKASISSLLANRALLYKKYGTLLLDNEAKIDTCPTNKDWEFITSVKKNIENNLANSDFNVDVLCTMHNMSRTSFFNKIKALTGYSPWELTHNIRLQHAARLLIQGFKPAEVSDMCGFCDTKYFRTVFKKYFKDTPKEYVKKQRGKRNKENQEDEAIREITALQLEG